MQRVIIPLFVLFLLLSAAPAALAQKWVEPKVEPKTPPTSPYQQGYRNGMGFDIMLNDYSFGIGWHYRRAVSPMREFVMNVGIGALKDATEQNFISFYGTEVVPNKYNRVLNFPITFGLKQRLFAPYIQDNFRVNVEGAVGPAIAFAYPYFKDYNHDGVRWTNYGYPIPYEPQNDVLSGWGSGHFKFGGVGELMMAIDFGSKMKKFTTLKFGYVIQYYKQGIQIMEPYKYQTNAKGDILVDGNGNPITIPANPPQRFFGSPQFEIIIGGFW